MGVNALCLLLTADPVFPRGFGVVLCFALCSELQQLSLLGERSSASLDWSWEWSRVSPDLCPSALLVLLLLPSSQSAPRAPGKPEGIRPSQVLLWAVVLLFLLPKIIYMSYLIAPSFSSLVQGLPATSCSHWQRGNPGNCCWSALSLPGLLHVPASLGEQHSRREARTASGCSGTTGMRSMGV